MRRAAPLTAALLLAVMPAIAAEPAPPTVEWIYSDAGENATKLPQFAWTKAGDVLLMDETRPEEARTIERWATATGRRTAAVDAAAALASLEDELAPADRPKGLAWPEAFSDDGRRAVYVLGGDLFVLDLPASRFARLTRTPEPEEAASISPDGTRVAFVRGHDLYTVDVGHGAETRLTGDGSDTVLNGTPSWVYWEEILDHRDAAYWWSPDSRTLAFLRTDESGVDVAVFPDYRPAAPRVERQRYPKAGDRNPIVRVGLVAAAGGPAVFVPGEAMPYEYVVGVTWLPDGKRVAVQVTNRMQDRLDLYLVDRATGEASRILTEHDDGWVDQHELQFLDGGKRFVWSSERDGHTHLYLYDDAGKLLNRITEGDWSVRGPDSFYGEALGSAFVDEAHGRVYFTALAKSPVERQLYRVGLDGRGMERVSKEDGVHRVTFNAGRSAYVDAASAHCTPPSLTLHDGDGARRAVLGAAAEDLEARLDWQCPELLTVPADDGFPLPVRLVKPKRLEPGRRYPVILYLYGGPSAPTVKDAWNYSFAENSPFDQILVREGFVVMSVDPRSATGISKTLENLVARKAWGDVELKDFLAGVRWVKAQPWADPERVGVWGWSGGGTSTLMLMTRSQEFRAGIAVAPNVDWRFYDSKFTEAYMKTPADNPEGYAETSLVARAKDLHGRLLLVHGTGDDNVHPQHSWAFVEALVQARKPFDLMMYPMRKHTIKDRPARIHLFDKMLEFWKRNLEE